MIRFIFEKGKPTEGKLVYREKEYSFDTEPRSGIGIGSLLVNDLQLEMDRKGQILYVWGLCPHTAWKPGNIKTPAAESGILRVKEVVSPYGASKKVNNEGHWQVSANRESGWVCVGNSNANGQNILFAPGAIAVLIDGSLNALWLHPDALPSR